MGSRFETLDTGREGRELAVEGAESLRVSEQIRGTQGRLAIAQDMNSQLGGDAQRQMRDGLMLKNFPEQKYTPEQTKTRVLGIIDAHIDGKKDISGGGTIPKAYADILKEIDKRLTATERWVKHKNFDLGQKPGFSYIRPDVGANRRNNVDVDRNKLHAQLTSLPAGDMPFADHPKIKLYRRTLLSLIHLNSQREERIFQGKVLPQDVVECACRDPDAVKGAGQAALFLAVGALFGLAVIRDAFGKKLHMSTLMFAGLLFIMHDPQRFINSFSKEGLAKNFMEDIGLVSNPEFQRIIAALKDPRFNAILDKNPNQDAVGELTKYAMQSMRPMQHSHVKKTLEQWKTGRLDDTEIFAVLTDPKDNRNRPLKGRGIDEDIARVLVEQGADDSYYLMRMLARANGRTRTHKAMQTAIYNYVTNAKSPVVSEDFRRMAEDHDAAERIAATPPPAPTSPVDPTT